MDKSNELESNKKVFFTQDFTPINISPPSFRRNPIDYYQLFKNSFNLSFAMM